MSQISGHADNHKEGNDFIPSSKWGDCVLADVELIKSNLLDIEKKIAPCKPRIIGVTKYYGVDAVVEGYKAGLRDFAESRVLDAISKLEALPQEIKQNSTFHFIGHLQTNKAEKAVKHFDYIHSVDSLKLAKIISETACQLNKREKILLQVNLANEEQKFGYTKEGLKKDFKDIYNLLGLDVVGLMCMAPFDASDEELRAFLIIVICAVSFITINLYLTFKPSPIPKRFYHTYPFVATTNIFEGNFRKNSNIIFFLLI